MACFESVSWRLPWRIKGGLLFLFWFELINRDLYVKQKKEKDLIVIWGGSIY